MSFGADVGQFTVLTTDIVTTVKTVTLARLGALNPKWALVWMTGQGGSAGTDGAAAGNVLLSIGLCAGTTNYSVGGLSQSGVTPSNCSTAFRATAAIMEQNVNGLGGQSGSLVIHDMTTAGQISFRVTGVFAANRQINVYAQGGTAVVPALFDFAVAAGTNAVTTPAAPTKAAIFIGTNMSGGLPLNATARMRIFAGMALPASAENFVIFGTSEDAQAASSTSSYSTTNECIAASQASGSMTLRAKVTGQDANGFTLQAVESSGHRVACLALSGTFQVAFDETDTQFPVDGESQINPGFTDDPPLSGIGFSVCTAIDTPDVFHADNEMCIGAFTAPQDTGAVICSSYNDPTGLNPTAGATAIDHDAMYVNLDPAAAIEGSFGRKVAANNPQQFTLEETITDVASARMQIMVFGDAPLPVAPGMTKLGGTSFWRRNLRRIAEGMPS